MNKCICYCATRNIYYKLPTAINSVLQNNPNIDKIFCILEDDALDIIKHPKVEIINSKNLNIIPIESSWGAMANMRFYLPEVFTDLDKILYLDIDTIVNDNIENLWNINLDNYLVGGVNEIHGWLNDPPPIDQHDRKLWYKMRWIMAKSYYINSGVLLLNLTLMRQQKLTNKLDNFLRDHIDLYCPDQDTINICCKDKILKLDATYNNCISTGYIEEPAIRHYAGVENFYDSCFSDKLYLKYYCNNLNFKE